MLYRQSRIQPVRLKIWSIRILVLLLALSCLVFLPAQVSAQSHQGLSTPTLGAQLGFNGRYRAGSWLPVLITLKNTDADFNGTVSITVTSPFTGPQASSNNSYQQPISLPAGSQKEVTINIPMAAETQGTTQNISVQLLDASNNSVASQKLTASALNGTDVFIGILSDHTQGFAPLYSAALPAQAGNIIVEPFNANSLPSAAPILQNFDVLILDNFTTATLSKTQLLGLETWVNQGGTLIEAGGPEWQRTLSPLPRTLLPVTITGTQTLPAGTSVIPPGSPMFNRKGEPDVAPAIPGELPISTSQVIYSQHTGILPGKYVGQSTVLQAAGNTPLIVQSARGAGSIYYLAFDPGLDPVASWSGTSTLWKGLLLRSLGEQALTPVVPDASIHTPGIANTLASVGNILQNMSGVNVPSPWLLLTLLLGYLLILGPVRFLIIRWRKRRDWNWRIVLSSIIVFSLLTYGLALQQKGTAVLSNTLSVIQLNQDSQSAHVSTYTGVFVPNQGDFHVRMPGNNLVQSVTGPYFSQGQSSQNSITNEDNATDVNLKGVDIWTLRSLVAEQDQQVSGSITSHLIMQNGQLTGTITNTLPYGLSDVYILMADSFVHFDHLAAGETQTVNTQITSNSTGQHMLLVDQIAQATHQQIPQYYSPNDIAQIQDASTRHLMLLSGLSGEGNYNYCTGNVCSSSAYLGSRKVAVFSGSGPQSFTLNANDPLLINGAPATLIGWIDQNPHTITVNGTIPEGLQETLLQAPLDMQIIGGLSLPDNFISAHLVDVQSDNLQLLYPGDYTMTTGSMTFEYTLPAPSVFQTGSITMTEPDLSQVQQYRAPGPTGLDANHLQGSIYNWQTKTWDAFTFSQYSFSPKTPAPYVDNSGRVLVRLSAPSSSGSPINFGSPTLQIQGEVVNTND